MIPDPGSLNTMEDEYYPRNDDHPYAELNI